MSEFWKSTGRKYCEICQCWFADNSASGNIHNNGNRHKKNLELKLKRIEEKSVSDKKEEKELNKILLQINRSAEIAYGKDVRGEGSSAIPSRDHLVDQNFDSTQRKETLLEKKKKNEKKKLETNEERAAKQRELNKQKYGKKNIEKNTNKDTWLRKKVNIGVSGESKVDVPIVDECRISGWQTVKKEETFESKHRYIEKEEKEEVKIEKKKESDEEDEEERQEEYDVQQNQKKLQRILKRKTMKDFKEISKNLPQNPYQFNMTDNTGFQLQQNTFNHTDQNEIEKKMRKMTERIGWTDEPTVEIATRSFDTKKNFFKFNSNSIEQSLNEKVNCQLNEELTSENEVRNGTEVFGEIKEMKMKKELTEDNEEEKSNIKKISFKSKNVKNRKFRKK
ncbi:hypothetical protein SNEBB_002466 [Seison nebaliae]|nr:hypothetical protein SNEBB_002466 [Seison nebaliae]